MIRPYKLRNHKFCEVQSFVNYIFLEVLCKAPSLKDRFQDLVPEMVIEKYRFFLNGKINEDYVFNPLRVIYGIIQGLSAADIKMIRKAVLVNNRVRELCAGEYVPVLYSDLERIDKQLAKQIKLFCNHLYDEVTKSKFFCKYYSTLDDYYKSLVGTQTRCGCCGVRFIMNRYHSYRSALDHFLPRDKYPFVSMNVRNLVPICDTCNSKYKLAKDTLHLKSVKDVSLREEKRVKAFYPFRYTAPDIDISVSIRKGCHFDQMTPGDIRLAFGCEGHQEEVENWCRIFGIRENYKAIYCSDEMYGFLEENYIAKKTRNESLDDYIEGLVKNRDFDMNFLKAPFLRCFIDDEEMGRLLVEGIGQEG